MHLRMTHSILVLLVFAVSCDESLPPRQDPSNLFSTQLAASYLYTADSNNVIINLVATNNFDETLSDVMSLEGTVVITSIRDTSVHQTIHLSRANLIQGKYDPLKNTLTIDPGSTVIIQVSWDFTDDAGRSLTTDFFHYNIDRMCKQRELADPESFTISAKVRLYAKLGYAQSSTFFQISQYDHFVGPHDCTPL
jgi:hypothetical protein